MKRKIKYGVELKYVCASENSTTFFGKLDKKMLTMDELEFLFQIISPLNSPKWLKSVKFLPKGSTFNINLNENTEYGMTGKILSITY